MARNHKELLRLHVEAVWGVRLPTLICREVELLPDSPRPPWHLYSGTLDSEHICIWSPGLDQATRSVLHTQLEAVTSSQVHIATIPGISQEVALLQIAPPRMEITEARKIAQAIYSNEQALFSGDENRAAYFAESSRGPLFGVIRDGRLLCIAHSSCRTTEACELGLETLPEARRKGYALAATLLWAETVQQEGLIPFYSARAENTASLKLAEAAGYRPFAYGATIKLSS